MTSSGDVDLLGTLSVLYELSLSIGRSLDFDDACRDFLVPLMSRKNLSHATVWRCDDRGLTPVWSMPSTTLGSGEPSIPTPVIGGRPHAVGPDDDAWELFSDAHGLADGDAAVFPLPGVGVLTVRRGPTDAGFDYATLAQLQPLMEQFAISLQAADAFLAQRSERTRLDLMFEAVNDAIVLCDIDGRIQRLNDRVLNWSVTAETAEFICEVALHGDALEAAVASLRDAASGTRARVEETELIDSAGNRRTVSWSLVTAEIGGHQQIVASGADVTHWRTRADSLRLATEAAEEANLAKSRFLSRVSHELRTPLNAVLGFTELATMSEIDDDAAESLDRVLAAGRHLLTLIDDVLDVSRVEAGELSLHTETVDMADIVTEAHQMVQSLADQKGIRIEQIDIDGLPDVRVDPGRACQVLVNLLSNAVKFNRPDGSVVVRGRVRDDAVTVSVTDTGSGIAPDELGRLFVPFDRLGRERSEIEGTGIGLALSKSMAETMGGALRVRSEVGVGSTFVFEVPRTTLDDTVVAARDGGATRP